MSELTFEGFKQFVNSQEPDEEINHYGDGWTECAVGLYVKSEENGEEPDWMIQEMSIDFVSDVIPAPLDRQLNGIGIASEMFPTYRELQKELEKY